MHLKKIFIKICASQKKRASHQQFIKKHASQGFLDPIQKHALSRSVQLEVVYVKALLYLQMTLFCYRQCDFILIWILPTMMPEKIQVAKFFQ